MQHLAPWTMVDVSYFWIVHTVHENNTSVKGYGILNISNDYELNYLFGQNVGYLSCHNSWTKDAIESWGFPWYMT